MSIAVSVVWDAVRGTGRSRLRQRALDLFRSERCLPNATLSTASAFEERLLRALLLQALFSVHSERQLMKHINYNMMFRWFVGLAMDAPVWDVTVFTKNRERLLQGDIVRGFLAAILVDP